MAYRVCVATDCSEKPSAFTLQCVAIHVSKRLWYGREIAGKSFSSSLLLKAITVAGKSSSRRMQLGKAFPSCLALPEPVPVVEKGSSSGDAGGHYTAKHNSVGGGHNFGKWRTMKGLYSGTYSPPAGVSVSKQCLTDNSISMLLELCGYEHYTLLKEMWSTYIKVKNL